MTKLTLTLPAQARRRRDWERILLDIRSAGCSLSNVARLVERDEGTLRRWMEGSDPKEHDARMVLTLYAKLCPEKFRVHQQEFAVVDLVAHVVSRDDYVASQQPAATGGGDDR